MYVPTKYVALRVKVSRGREPPDAMSLRYADTSLPVNKFFDIVAWEVSKTWEVFINEHK